MGLKIPLCLFFTDDLPQVSILWQHTMYVRLLLYSEVVHVGKKMQGLNHSKKLIKKQIKKLIA